MDLSVRLNSPGGRQNNFGPISSVPTKSKGQKSFQQHSGRKLFQKEKESIDQKIGTLHLMLAHCFANVYYFIFL